MCRICISQHDTMERKPFKYDLKDFFQKLFKILDIVYLGKHVSKSLLKFLSRICLTPMCRDFFFLLFFRTIGSCLNVWVRSKTPPQIPHDQDSTQIVEYFVYIVLLVRAHMGIFLASNVIYRSQHISPWYLVIWQFVRDQFAQGKKHKAKDVVKVFLVEMLTYV